MKSLYLSLALVLAAAVVVEANAGYWRRNRGYGYGYGSNCGSCRTNDCAAPCAAPCRPACAPAACPSYVVEEEAICNPPRCERAVVVTEPAICHRVCSWSCPPGTTMAGTEAVEGDIELVNQHGQKHRVKASGANY